MEQLLNVINWDLLDKILFWVLFLIWLFWIRWILWVAKDIIQRTDSLFLEIFSILLVTFLWPIGFLFYFILRPTSYKWDANWRREAILTQIIVCPECWELNPKEHDYCCFCGAKLKVECKECKKLYPYDYDFCPRCWAPNIES